MCTDAQGNRYALQPGDVFIRPAHTPHRIERPDPSAYLEWFLRLSDAQVNAAREWGLIQPNQHRCHLPLATWLPRILDWCQAFRQPTAETPDNFQHWQRLYELLRAAREQHHEPEAALAQQVSRLLAQDIQSPRSIRQIAADLGISTARLRQLVHSSHGMGPKAYRTRQRIQAACGLLMDQNLSVAAVAEAMGYPDAFTFSKQFKRVLGQSPSEYRRG